MAKEIYVKVEILTKKNEVKIESFFMDKQMYEAILTLPKEEQRIYFAEEYYEYEANRRYHRRFVSLDKDNDDGLIQDIPDNSPTMLENILDDLRIQEIKDAVSKLTKRQQEIKFTVFLNKQFLKQWQEYTTV